MWGYDKHPGRMGDAFKCKNCGTVVETPQSCPSCGETGMRPVQVPESVLDGDDGASDNESTDAEAGDDESAAGPVTADSGPDDHSESSDRPADDDGGSHRRERERTSDSGGLVAWLKSLF